MPQIDQLGRVHRQTAPTLGIQSCVHVLVSLFYAKSALCVLYVVIDVRSRATTVDGNRHLRVRVYRDGHQVLEPQGGLPRNARHQPGLLLLLIW